MSLLLVVPDRGPLGPSGGDRYDASVAAAWRRAGRALDVEAVPGGWPWPEEEDLRRLSAVLAGQGPVLLDGLVACSAPRVVEDCARRRPTTVLVHAPLVDGSGARGERAARLTDREGRALTAAHAVVTTSRFAADDLERRYGLEGVAVARPGVEPAPVAEGSLDRGEPAQLLVLAALTPAKNHALLLESLEQVADLPWSLLVVGPAPDPGHLRSLQHDVQGRGLRDRVRWLGVLEGQDLAQVWAGTDLLLHPSRSETYGMVVAEAHAHGIPAVVGAGTGAVEALVGGSEPGPAAGSLAGGTEPSPAGGSLARGSEPGPGSVLPGCQVDTTHPDPLARALRRWLTQPDLRRDWRQAALRRREEQTGWDRTARELDEVLADQGGDRDQGGSGR